MTGNTQDLEIYHKRARMAITFLTEYLEHLLDILIRQDAFSLMASRKTFVAVLLKKFNKPNKTRECFKVSYKRHLERGYSVWKTQDGDESLYIVQFSNPSFLSVPRCGFSAWEMTLLFSFDDPKCKIFYNQYKRYFLSKGKSARRCASIIIPNEGGVGLHFRIAYGTLSHVPHGFRDVGIFEYNFYNDHSWSVKNIGSKHCADAALPSYRTRQIYLIDEFLFVDPLLFKGQLLTGIYNSWKSTWLASD